jgi:small conductance mechanosensitive channel
MFALLLQQAAAAAKPTEVGPTVIWRSVLHMAHTFLDEVPYLIIGAVVLLMFTGASFLFRRLIHSASRRARLNLMLADVFARLTQAITIIFGILIAAVIVVPSFNLGSLVAGLGISSVAIGFAFKDILQNFFAGILLLWRQPFRIGDQIKVNNYEGTVEEISAQSTGIKTYAGEKVIIPNSEVYISPILHFTAYEKVRGEFDVPLDSGGSIQRVKQLIIDALRQTHEILVDSAPAVFVFGNIRCLGKPEGVVLVQTNPCRSDDGPRYRHHQCEERSRPPELWPEDAATDKAGQSERPITADNTQTVKL